MMRVTKHIELETYNFFQFILFFIDNFSLYIYFT